VSVPDTKQAGTTATCLPPPPVLLAQALPPHAWKGRGMFLTMNVGLILTLSEPACSLWMERPFSLLRQRKTLETDEVNDRWASCLGIEVQLV